MKMKINFTIAKRLRQKANKCGNPIHAKAWLQMPNETNESVARSCSGTRLLEKRQADMASRRIARLKKRLIVSPSNGVLREWHGHRRDVQTYVWARVPEKIRGNHLSKNAELDHSAPNSERKRTQNSKTYIRKADRRAEKGRYAEKCESTRKKKKSRKIRKRK
jgi:hypothetical protein